MLKSLLTPEQIAAGPIWGGIAIGGTLLGWGLGGWSTVSSPITLGASG